MAHVAFDLGLTTTGFAWPGGSDYHVCPPALRRSPMTEHQHQDRFDWWRTTFAALLLPHEGVDVICEAPFLHPKHPAGSVALIMLHGVLRGVAAGGGHKVYAVAPSALKRWATGNGSANKDRMIQAAIERGWQPDSNVDHNEADAWLLYTMWAEGREAAA